MSLIQLASTWLDREANARRMAELVRREAAEHQADLIVFPELATTGYIEPFTDKEFALRLYAQSEVVPGPTTEALGAAARQHGVHVVTGISRLHPTIPHVLFNSAVLIGPDGGIVGVQNKVHACKEEKNYYVAGNSIDVFQTNLGNLGLSVCYDVRFPEVARIQALKGAEIIVSVWASFKQPNRIPNDSIIYRCATRAMENAVFFLGANRSGREGNREFYGRSVIAAPSGDIIARSHGEREEIVRGALEATALREQRAHYTIFRDRRPELYGSLIEPL